MGTIVGVEISKPAPWPPAKEIIELKEKGLNFTEISKKTGYSIPTIKRAIETKGEDRRIGPQCMQLEGRVFSVKEALQEMPMPCGPDCVCMWKPVFNNDLI